MSIKSKPHLLCLSVVLLGIVAVWSLGVGASALPFADLFDALRAPDDGRASLILWQVRLPRLVAALAAGAGLAVAGAIMQAVTGNPLADPGLLGVNAGAAFAVVVLSALTVGASGAVVVWVAMGGAALASLLVYALGSVGRSGATPIKLILAGVILGAFLISITTAVLILDAQTLEEVRFWTVGSLRNRAFGDYAHALPYLGAGLAGALMLRQQFTALSLGGEVAAGLGQSQSLWRALALALIVMMAGAAVAIAGPISFVGLVVPHIVRLGVSWDYRWIVPFCAVWGAGLTLLADTLPRALWARDIPIGVTLALLGAPFFIALARRNVGRISNPARAN